MDSTSTHDISVGPVADPKHGDLWFDDGNIILEAELTQFKVYRGILSRSSAIFRDMFEVPQPAEDTTVDGCLVVHLSDSAEDLSYVLDALCHGRQYHDITRPQPFPILAAFLRLGTKYEIAQLRSEAMERLSAEYPSQLEKWDERCARSKAQIKPRRGLDFDVINLALEANALSLLPAAFYSYLMDYDCEEVLGGIIREDLSVAKLSDEYREVCIRG